MKSSRVLSDFKINLLEGSVQIDRRTELDYTQGVVSFYKNRLITFVCLTVYFRTQAVK
jgi:hypothetical protein